VAVKPIIRPATITPIQMTSDSEATARASGGAEGAWSHPATVRRAVSSNTTALSAASTSSTTFARK